MKVHTAKEGFATEAEGRMRVVSQGETFAAGHPVVKAHPGAFADAAPPENEAPQAEAKRRKRSRSSG